MEKSEAVAILRKLVLGIHPVTDESFPKDCPYLDPIVRRALFIALKTLEAKDPPRFMIDARETESYATRDEAEPKKKDSPTNAGSAWSKEEDEQLITEWDSGLKVSVLAKKHQRTRNAIKARLKLLGKSLAKDKEESVEATEHVISPGKRNQPVNSEKVEVTTVKKDKPANAGKPWDEQQEQKLIADFERGMTIPELAEKHQRTEIAIQSRLMRLGLIEYVPIQERKSSAT